MWLQTKKIPEKNILSYKEAASLAIFNKEKVSEYLKSDFFRDVAIFLIPCVELELTSIISKMNIQKLLIDVENIFFQQNQNQSNELFNKNNNINYYLNNNTFNDEPKFPSFYIEAFIRFIRCEDFSLKIEWIKDLFNFYYMYYDKYNIDNQVDNSIFLVMDLYVAITLRFPKDVFSFQTLAYKVFNELLSICRHSSYDLTIHAFRCISELYEKVGKFIIKESLHKIIVDIVFTFSPNHRLFSQIYTLICRNSSIYSDIRYLKLLIKLKMPVNLQTFKLIDDVLSSHFIVTKPLTIFRFLVQQSVSNQIWNLTAITLIKKHCRILLQNRKTREWMRIFMRRTLQWIAIVASKRKYQNRRQLIARTLNMFTTFTPSSIVEEIKIDASTLIKNGNFPELSLYFTAEKTDKDFLNEISVIGVCTDLNEQLLWPCENLRYDQLQRINTMQKINSGNKEKIVMKDIDDLIPTKDELAMSSDCYHYLFLSLLFTIFFLIIVN